MTKRTAKWIRTLTCFATASSFACAVGTAEPTSNATKRVDYASEIHPVLKRNCYECHGPMDVPSGKLRLDERARALEGGRSGVPSIIPGNGAESPLVIVISGGDGARWRPMPPRGKPLRPEQVQLLRRWIDQGAAFDAE